MTTFADRISATKGHSSGFDYLRLGLAVGILIIHSVLAATGHDGYKSAEGWLVHNYLEPALVPCFFALSGYLVAGSLERSRTIITFVGLRVLRIFPALAVETLLSALILGIVFTALPLGSYFRDPLFWSYLGNIVGHVQFKLPEVFSSNPDPNVVNGQLWTVPYELFCYISIVALALLGRSFVRLSVTASILGMILLYLVLRGGASVLPTHYELIAMFLLGVALFLYRDVIPWNAPLALTGTALYLIAQTRYSFWVPLGWIGLAYLTIYIGLCNPRKLAVLKGADYSYGIYLYHYAVLQAVTASIGPGAQWWKILLYGLPLTTAFAALSWHLVERHALALRRYLPSFESTLALIWKKIDQPEPPDDPDHLENTAW